MNIEQSHWTVESGWNPAPADRLDPQLALVFGSRGALGRRDLARTIRSAYPRAHLMGSSTAGEISGTRVHDDSLVVTAVHFERTELKLSRVRIEDVTSSHEAGRVLAKSLSDEALVHVFVLSDGLHVNGSELVEGILEELPTNVTVTGGLAGDGEEFQETLLVWNDIVESGSVVALGLYGEDLKVGYGSLGGWDPFGPERLITRSEGNVLFELDGRSALELYKTYLGEHADGLPATGLLFPLALRNRNGAEPVVRTILSIDEHAESMTFAGDVPQGALARLMMPTSTASSTEPPTPPGSRRKRSLERRRIWPSSSAASDGRWS